MESTLYIGILSGTSMDGIDVALIDTAQQPPQLLAKQTVAYDPDLRADLQQLIETQQTDLSFLARLDRRLGMAFGQAAKQLLHDIGRSSEMIHAIGSHGQTLAHRPNGVPGSTLQLGCPSTIAHVTGITTVADFRRRDIAEGGQGAPLAPLFHQFCFATESPMGVLNIGGIANLTVIPARGSVDKVMGFDTGPGNTLMDAWIKRHKNLAYDEAGQWAASGEVQTTLLSHLLSDPYFAQASPKSTGTDHFNEAWLDSFLKHDKACPEDIQATLLALTVHSMADAVTAHLPIGAPLIICGGGSFNSALRTNLEKALPAYVVQVSTNLGIDADALEAMLFAWLAKKTLEREALNFCSVTGAERPAILGGIYPA